MAGVKSPQSAVPPSPPLPTSRSRRSTAFAWRRTSTSAKSSPTSTRPRSSKTSGSSRPPRSRTTPAWSRRNTAPSCATCSKKSSPPAGSNLASSGATSPCQSDGNDVIIYHPESLSSSSEGHGSVGQGSSPDRGAQRRGRAEKTPSLVSSRASATEAGMNATVETSPQGLSSRASATEPRAQASGEGTRVEGSWGSPKLELKTETSTSPRELLRFTFPRQREGRRLCISDFFAPRSSGQMDVIGLSLVTIGSKASEVTQQLFHSGEYTRYLYLHGLSVETAEALAEYWHKHMREELGIAGDDSPRISDLFHQKYRGSRYSFGYPACPNLEDQAKLFNLLHPEENVGVRLTTGFLLEPEQST